MKRFVLFCFVLFCFNLKTKGQNLVPNPSFENHTDCSYFLLSNAYPWCTISSNGGQSTYYNPCFSSTSYQTPSQYLDNCFKSYQLPHSGLSYIDIASYVMGSNQESSVPQVKLIDTLKAGKIYCVTYYVSVWNNAKYTIDKLGALLTATPFPCSTPGGTIFVNIAGQYTPQVVTTPSVAIGDTLNWTEVSGTFTAIGNEAHLAIGDFFTHSQHYIQNTYPTNCNGLAYYYVDDVSVEVVEIAKAKNDTLIYQGDSVLVGANNSEAALFNWQPTAGLSCTNCPNPKASPNITTTYTVTKTQCKAVTSDVITVSVSPTGINELVTANGFKINPNPANEMINLDIGSIDKENIKIKITDVLGKELLFTEYQKQINISQLEIGIYFISILQGQTTLVTKKVIKE